MSTVLVLERVRGAPTLAMRGTGASPALLTRCSFSPISSSSASAGGASLIMASGGRQWLGCGGVGSVSDSAEMSDPDIGGRLVVLCRGGEGSSRSCSGSLVVSILIIGGTGTGPETLCDMGGKGMGGERAPCEETAPEG